MIRLHVSPDVREFTQIIGAEPTVYVVTIRLHVRFLICLRVTARLLRGQMCYSGLEFSQIHPYKKERRIDLQSSSFQLRSSLRIQTCQVRRQIILELNQVHWLSFLWEEPTPKSQNDHNYDCLPQSPLLVTRLFTACRFDLSTIQFTRCVDCIQTNYWLGSALN